MKGYIYLFLTIVFEALSIFLMKLAEGAENKSFLISGGICYGITFFLFTGALKYLPMGYTNAVWAGASTLLVYMTGIFYFKEKTSASEIFFILCILTGIIGLNMVSKVK